jgi:uncharacterized protein with ParB-like and HNH nuclease domain
MDKYSSRTNSVNDFREWSEAGILILAPRFQRRSVWSDKARSYLIDTMLRHLPMPKIFMRQEIDDAGRTIREIVDGQQRIRTVLSYLKNGFPVMNVHGGSEFGGKYYDDLESEVKKEFLQYEFAVDLLIGLNEPDILDVFARLNTYGVRLNKQELINAKYFGYFKTTVYRLGYEFYRFWVDNAILSEKDIARMLEAELTTELVISMLAGIQSRKVVEGYYKKYEDNFPMQTEIVERFKNCMDVVGEVMGDRLATSNFSSKHLFYSLYCAVYDLLHGLPGSSIERIELSPNNISRIRNILMDIDFIFERDPDDIVGPDREFLDASTKHTTDLSARKTRHRYIVARILADLQPRRI